MRDRNEEIRLAAERFDQLADQLDPEQAHVEHTDELQEIAAISETGRADEARLRHAIADARAHGRSWNQIAVAVGVSHQAARQRFADKADG